VESRLGSPSFCGVDTGEATVGEGSLIAFRHGTETAIFRVRQAVRPDAEAMVRELARMGLQLHIVSGDRAAAAEPIASRLGVVSWHAGIRPAGKVAFLDELKAQGRCVLMVGDGINDVAALAAAHASLAPISAADISQARSDAVFVGESLAPVAATVRMARRARRAMLQNLALAVVYNAIAVPIAMAGIVTPLIAAAAMSGSSILVTLNALRLKRGRSNLITRAEMPSREAQVRS
jgi:Cu2+-exporting ATPase